MTERRDATPLIVRQSSNVERLVRLPLGERGINEDWVQEKLDNFPELLPINEIDATFGPLISLGREISTSVGPIDNLYISPQGSLTIVEAKLWRNPEARRQVIGQIIDYAKEISRWGYESLDAVSRANKGNSLAQLAAAVAGTDFDERQFVDQVARSLREGRFLLLIVGDGIREEMERLVEFLQQSPQLRFTLALVELQLFRLPGDEGHLVLPLIVARTQEIERAVVRVESSAGAQVSVSVEMPKPVGEEPAIRKTNLSRDQFFEELRNSHLGEGPEEMAAAFLHDFGGDERFRIDWKTASFSVKLRDPIVKSFGYSILVVTTRGEVYMDSLTAQLSRMGVEPELGSDFWKAAAALVGRTVTAKYGGSWDRPAKLADVAQVYSQLKELIDGLAKSVYAARQADNS